MYRPGHYGVALLAYAPVGALLVAAGFETVAFAGGALTLLLTPLPDYDQRVPLLSHRGPTHTVAFALLVGGALGAGGWLLAPAATGRTAAAAFGFGVGVLAVGAHLLADVVTPAGIRPFWPLSSRQYSLGLARASHPVANYLLLAAGVLATAVALLLSA